MVNIEQMKGTKKTQHRYNPEIGHYTQTTYYINGIKIWTGRRHPIAVEIPETKQELADLEEMAMFLEWREKTKAMYMTDEEFDKILTTKF